MVNKKETPPLEHGRVHFDIYPDKPFFVLWIQEDFTKIPSPSPQEERADYTSATSNAPSYVFLVSRPTCSWEEVRCRISQMYLVFTDIVGSTDLYAHQGDGQALQVVHTISSIVLRICAQRRIVTIAMRSWLPFLQQKRCTSSCRWSQKSPRECVNPQQMPYKLTGRTYRFSTGGSCQRRQ